VWKTLSQASTQRGQGQKIRHLFTGLKQAGGKSPTHYQIIAELAIRTALCDALPLYLTNQTSPKLARQLARGQESSYSAAKPSTHATIWTLAKQAELTAWMVPKKQSHRSLWSTWTRSLNWLNRSAAHAG